MIKCLENKYLPSGDTHKLEWKERGNVMSGLDVFPGKGTYRL